MKLELNMTVETIKQLLSFSSQTEARWILFKTACIKKVGEREIELASTDGMKLLAIRRPLEDGEFIDDNQYAVSLDNLPLKGKHLRYWLQVTDYEPNIACFSDFTNKFKFPMLDGRYPDYKKLIEELQAGSKATQYSVFQPKVWKPICDVLGEDAFKTPKTVNHHSFLWEKQVADSHISVIACSVRQYE